MPFPAPPVRNALSFDVEDWYHGIEMPMDTWGRFEERLHTGLDVVLQELRATQTRATFFILGWVGEHYPGTVARIAREGHEIGTHGYSHTKVYEMTPLTFREELRRSVRVLEDASGQRVRGHRAPYFSITSRCLWALDILEQEGLDYDASIYPGPNYRYGIPGFSHEWVRMAGGNFWECPVGISGLVGKQFGVGGAYFRILPYRYTADALRRRNERGLAGTIYLHPWEFDPGHPRIRFRPRAMATHYFNLSATLGRFRTLLREFEFSSYEDLLALPLKGIHGEARVYQA